MAKKRLEFYFEDRTGLNEKKLRKMFKDLYLFTANYLGLEGRYTLSCTVTDDSEIKRINNSYRHIDKPTDVVSFAYQDLGENIESPIKDLGEIVISIDTAQKQAKEFNHLLAREVAFLFIHGFLHLNGYDHIDEKEAEKMFELQNEVLNSFDASYSYPVLKEDVYYNFEDKEFMESLFKDVLEAQKHAYVPYSNFRVGAVVLARNGKKYFGCNIENSSYPLANCGERTAMFKAAYDGIIKNKVALLALVTDSPEELYASPCGACRQVMSELLTKTTPVVMFSKNGSFKINTVEELLPYMFTGENL